ncbi:MAG TPA: hypothetical protein PKY81_16430, partial [bacterium]|nr:hypothetical protein [bacterium]
MKSVSASDIFGNGILTDTTSADSWILNIANITGASDTYVIITATNYQNKTDTVLINILADTYCPAIALNAPADTYYSNISGIYFNWNNASDDKSGTKYYYLQISTDSSFTLCDSNVILTDTTGYQGNFNEGIYYWRVKLADKVGNLSSDTESEKRMFSVDMTKPVINQIFVYAVDQQDSKYFYRNGILSSVEEDTIWINSNKTIQFSIDAVWTDLNKDSFAGTNVFGTSPIDATASDSWILNYTSSLKFGDTEIIVSIYDKNGNVDTAKINVREDITAPTAAVLTSPSNMAQITSDTNLVWSASSDTQSGFTYYVVEVYDTNAVNGTSPVFSVMTTNLSVQLPVYSLDANTYCWRVLSYDNANNVDTNVSYNTFVLENKVPVIIGITLSSLQMNNLAFDGRTSGTYILNETEDTVYYSNFAASSNMTLNFCITWSNGDTIYNDTLYYSPAFATASGFITDAYSATSQSNTIPYLINRNVNYSDTRIIFIVNDKNDGDSDFAIINFKADTKTANVTLVSPIDDYCSSNLKPSFNWEPVVSEKYGTKGYYLKICSNTQFKTFEQSVFTTDTNYTLTANLSEGIHYWTVLAVDTLGNISDTFASSSFVYDTIIIDSTPPSINFIYVKSSDPEYLYYENQKFNLPLNIINKNSENVYINGNYSMNLILNAGFSDNNPEKIVFGKCYGNGDSECFTNNQDTCYYSNIGTNKGDTRILITVYDKSGLTDTAIVVIKEDKSVPYSAVLELPEDLTQEVQFDTYLIWTSDPDELSGISFFRVYADTMLNFENSYSLDTVSYVNIVKSSDLISASAIGIGDTIYWKIETFDNVDNSKMSSTKSYRVRSDFIPPSYSDEKPDNNSRPNNSASVISLKYNDASGIDTRYVNLYVNGAEVTSLCYITSSNISFETTGIYPHGEKVDVKAILGDVYNNTTTVQWSFIPVYKKLGVDILTPDSGYNTGNKIISIAGTAAAVKTGDKVLVYVNDINTNTVSLTPDANLNANWTSTVSLSRYGDIIRVYLSDTFGRTVQDSIAVNYFESFGIAITSPANNYDTLVKTITVRGTSKGVNTGDSIVLFRNGIEYDNYTVINHLDTEWSFAVELPSQNISLSVRLNSALFGQNAASYSITAHYIDTPIIMIQSPANNYDTNSNSVMLSGTTYNTLAGDGLTIYLNGTEISNFIVSSKNGVWSNNVNLSGKSDVLSIYAKDSFGRTGCDTIIVSYFKTPKIEIKSPLTNSCSTAKIITVSGTSLHSSANDSVVIFKNGSLQSGYTISGDNENWTGTVSLNSANDTILVKITDKFNQSSYDTIFLNYLDITSFYDTVVITGYEDAATAVKIQTTENPLNCVWTASYGTNLSVSVLEGDTDYISIIPKTDFIGFDTLILTVRYYPNLGNPAVYYTDSVSLIVNILNVNDTPEFKTLFSDTFVNVAKLFGLTVEGSDTDANPLTFSFSGAVPSGMTITRTNDTSALIRWTPAANQVDSYFINVRVSDNYNYYKLQHFIITVNRPIVMIASPLNNDCTTAKEIKISGITQYSSNNDDIKIFKNGILHSRVQLTADNGQWSGTVSLNSSYDTISVEILNRTQTAIYNADTIVLNYFDILTDTVVLTEDMSSTIPLLTTETPANVEWTIMTGNYQQTKIVEGITDYLIDTPIVDYTGTDTLMLIAVYYPDIHNKTKYIIDSKISNVIVMNVNDKPYFTSVPPVAYIEVSMPYEYLMTASDTDNDAMSY